MQEGAGLAAAAATETVAGAREGDAVTAAIVTPQRQNSRSGDSGAAVKRRAQQQQQSAPAWDVADISAGDSREKGCAGPEEEARVGGYGVAGGVVGGNRSSSLGDGYVDAGNGVGVVGCGSVEKTELR